IHSPAKEKTLVKWISQLTVIGYPASPSLVKEMAEEIQNQRFQLSKTAPLLRPMNRC
ncbi:MAG: hypothetical protein FE78DRAFT_151213, partial [Acidomyces sp. 'richmondensis']